MPTLRRPMRVTLEESLSAIASQGATRVDVLVRAGAADLSLEVRDDGKPLPAEAQLALLDSGNARIAPLGGTIDISPTANGPGTTLTWQAPIPTEWQT
jgi:signal transduction histidine kinase